MELKHQVDIDGVIILAIEPRCFKQGVREAIHIRIEWPSLNKIGAVTTSPLSGIESD